MMDGCSSMGQWTNMNRHQQHGLEISPPISLTFEPIHKYLHQPKNGQQITTNSEALIGPEIPLGSPLSKYIVQSQPVDQQSLECLFLSNKNNNSKKRSNIQSIQDNHYYDHDQFNKRQTINNYNNDNDSDNFWSDRPTSTSNINFQQGILSGFCSMKEPDAKTLKQMKEMVYTATTFKPGRPTSSSNINFQQGIPSGSSLTKEPDADALEQMKEMVYRAASFRPVVFEGDKVVETPKRKNVRISSEPQTVAARQRRERISERLRVLQKLVPGGSKMDTASMLDEAANYLKFLRKQVKDLEVLGNIKVDDCIFSPNYKSNHLVGPIHPEFSSMITFPMKTISGSTYSL